MEAYAICPRQLAFSIPKGMFSSYSQVEVEIRIKLDLIFHPRKSSAPALAAKRTYFKTSFPLDCKCKPCDRQFCLEHRRPSKHECSPVSVTGVRPNELDVKETITTQLPTKSPNPCQEGQSSESYIVRMQVSSMHLTLVSPVFKAMLSGHFKEGSQLKKAGYLEIPLPEDDPEAFTILLNIIHCHIKNVPRQVSGTMLTSLAILVNYYQLHEAVQFCSEAWIQNLDFKLLFDKGNTPALVQGLCVCWVFRNPELFRRITSILVWKMNGDLSQSYTRNLPLPDSLIGKIRYRLRCQILTGESGPQLD